MNYPGAGPQPPQMYLPPKKSVPVVPIVLGIFALLVVLAVVGGIKAFHAIKDTSSEAIAVGNSFVDNMGQHNYQVARSLLAAPVQAKTPAGDLKDLEAMAEKHHGAFLTHGQPQWNVQNWNGQTSVRLAYPAQFSKSVCTVSVTLVKTEQGYQVYEAHYQF